MRINPHQIQLPVIWVMATLLAIALIGEQPYLGLAVAILGGVALGLASIIAFDEAAQNVNHPPRKNAGKSSESREDETAG